MGLQVSDPEDVAQLHVESEAPSLSPPMGVQGLFWKWQVGTMRKQPEEVRVQEVTRQAPGGSLIGIVRVFP